MTTCCRLLGRGKDGQVEAVLCSHITSSSWSQDVPPAARHGAFLASAASDEVCSEKAAAPAGSGGGWRSPPWAARGSLSPTPTAAASTLPAADMSASCPCLQNTAVPSSSRASCLPGAVPTGLGLESSPRACSDFPSSKDFAACNSTL